MFDVICVGSATVDTFARTRYSELIKILDVKGEHDLLAYPTGGKILIEELDYSTGGGGTNVAASLALLGLKTAYLGCLGEDTNAEAVLKDLKKYKINASHVVRKKGHTGFSIILDSLEHDRTILAYKGVNNDLSPSDIGTYKTKWLYYSAMLGKAFKAQVKLAKYAQKNRIKIAYNISSYLAEKGPRYLKPILSRTDILILNTDEARLIVGMGDFRALGKKLSALGPSYVVITDGRSGAYCYHEGELYFAKTNDIKVVETTGAGDAFASTFLAGIIMDKGIPFAMQLATTNAESVISHHGAKNKLLKLREAVIIMKRRPVKMSKI